MIAVVGGIGLSGTLAISVLQRTREIGVLRAIGAPGRAIFRLFLMEGVLHGIAAWLLSVPLAYLAAQPVADQLGQTMLGLKLDFSFDARAIGYWLVIVLLLACFAAYWPARRAASMTIKACFGH
jgi:putative ABC transport system permease protein